MDTPTRRTLYRFYRFKEYPYIAGAFTITGILLTLYPDPLAFGNDRAETILSILFEATTFFNAILFLTAIYVRIIYRRNPYCAACGLDEVDCKINRNSISQHRPELHQ